jgi:hypothetical protein
MDEAVCVHGDPVRFEVAEKGGSLFFVCVAIAKERFILEFLSVLRNLC